MAAGSFLTIGANDGLMDYRAGQAVTLHSPLNCKLYPVLFIAIMHW
jgi:hypothetical protein